MRTRFAAQLGLGARSLDHPAYVDGNAALADVVGFL
jgi:hypothetical protein